MAVNQMSQVSGSDVPPAPEGPGLPTQCASWMAARARLAWSGSEHSIAVETAQGGRALAPLRRTRLGLREMPLMDAPGDFAWTDAAALAALAGRLVAERTAFFLERLPADSPTLAALRQACRGRVWLLVVPTAPTPVIDTRARTVAGLAGASLTAASLAGASLAGPGLKIGLDHAARRMARRGTLRYELRAPRSRRDLETLIFEAFDVETRSRRHDLGTALTAPGEAGFAAAFRGFLEDAYREGHLRFAFLRLDGKAVAMQIASVWNGRFWVYRSAWDRTHAEARPGDLLQLYVLREVAEQGLAGYAVLGGREPAPEAPAGANAEAGDANLMVFGLPRGLRGVVGLVPVAAWIARDRLRRRLTAWSAAAETGALSLPGRADALLRLLCRVSRRLG